MAAVVTRLAHLISCRRVDDPSLILLDLMLFNPRELRRTIDTNKRRLRLLLGSEANHSAAAYSQEDRFVVRENA